MTQSTLTILTRTDALRAEAARMMASIPALTMAQMMALSVDEYRAYQARVSMLRRTMGMLDVLEGRNDPS